MPEFDRVEEPTSTESGTSKTQNQPSIVWRVKITLLDVEPEVWRLILVRPDTKLSQLHRYVQAAMGWQESHLYAFQIGDREYGFPDDEFGQKVFDAGRYRLVRLINVIPASFAYVYDFGDQWTHRIEVEAIEEAVSRKQYPICIAGAGDCPPEDCGGPSGYHDLRAALADSRHPQHAELRDWIQSLGYDLRFQMQDATWSMRAVQRGSR